MRSRRLSRRVSPPVFLSDAVADANKNNFNDLLYTYRVPESTQGYSQQSSNHKLLGDNQVISVAADAALTTTATSGNNNKEIADIFAGTIYTHGVEYSVTNVFKLLLLIEAYPVHVCCSALADGTNQGDLACAGCFGMKQTS